MIFHHTFALGCLFMESNSQITLPDAIILYAHMFRISIQYRLWQYGNHLMYPVNF